MVYELGGQQIWVRVLALLLSNFVTFSKSVSPSLDFFICKINSNYPIRLLWILNNYSMKSLIIVSKYGIPSKAGFVNSNFIVTFTPLIKLQAFLWQSLYHVTFFKFYIPCNTSPALSDCVSKIPSPLPSARTWVPDTFYHSLDLDGYETYKKSQPKAQLSPKFPLKFENRNTKAEEEQIFCPNNRKYFPKLESPLLSSSYITKSLY